MRISMATSTNDEGTLTSPKICGRGSIRSVSFFFLGTCAWSLVNAIFAELPLILGWNGDWSLASSISLGVALSNLFPFLWSIVADSRGGKPIVSTSTGIGALLLFGLGIGLAFCFADVAGQTANSPALLLALSTGAGVVGTMSLVLFFPHAYESARVDNGGSITSLGSGTAIANLFLAAMAMVQGPGLAQPRFSMSDYFGICVAFFGLALVGWIGTIVYKPEDPSAAMAQKESSNDVEDVPAGQAVVGWIGTEMPKKETENDVEKATTEEVNKKSEFQFAFWRVLGPIATDPRFREANIVQLCLNAMAMFLPGIAPFSVAHFPDANLALQYLTISQLVAQTVGIAATGIRSLKSEKLTLWLVGTVLIWIPIVVLSILNDNFPSFHGNQAGAAAPITFNAIFNLLYGYVSTTCFQVVGARCQDGENGEHATRVLGFLNQVGSMTGSIAGYLVVTKAGLL